MSVKNEEAIKRILEARREEVARKAAEAQAAAQAEENSKATRAKALATLERVLPVMRATTEALNHKLAGSQVALSFTEEKPETAALREIEIEVSIEGEPAAETLDITVNAFGKAVVRSTWVRSGSEDFQIDDIDGERFEALLLRFVTGVLERR